ncbi:helix-turn-helix transcriptional regulator [Nocardia sp. CA-120079]|uniref:helix-turn-helix transcriptional regulator n=1 Tax=Nocardia sp. CA-120079 TaxID=3239974 RepID=UPI003D97FC4F
MTREQWVQETLNRIGQEVKRTRIAADITQDELAASVGLTRNALQNLESPANRRSTIDLLTLMLIARRLGRPPVEFIYPDLADGPVEIWPGVTTTSFEAVQWISGEIPAFMIVEDDTTRASTNLRVGMSRIRARLRNALRQARLNLIDAQLTPKHVAFSKEQAAKAITETQGGLDKHIAEMKQQGLTVKDDA